jgi:hypothetical protein
MSRNYIIPANNVTLTGASTAVFVQTAASAPIVVLDIIRAYASQSSSTSSLMQRIQISRQASTFPTLTSQAPIALPGSDPVSKITGATTGAAGTSGVNASAEGGGAKTAVYPDAFNILNGWLYVPTPDERMVESTQSTAEGLGIVFPAAPSSLGNWNVGLVFRELG